MATVDPRNENIPDPSLPLTEILKTIPEFFGVRVNEEPAYQVIEKHGDVEIRHYEAQVMASVTVVNEDFDAFREHAFKRLAYYIFGGNFEKEKMAMTAPVLQEKSGRHAWTMSFILPKGLDLSNLPQPLDEGVRVEARPAQHVAVLRYGGNNSLAKMKEHESLLEGWLQGQSAWIAMGDIYCAQDEAPFVLPIAKRNEVQIHVRHAH